MIYYKNLFFILCLFLFICPPATAWQIEDIYKQSHTTQKSPYTILDENEYKKVIQDSRNKIHQLLIQLKPYRHQNIDKQIAFIAQQLIDIPYMHVGAMGEGDWQPHSLTYQPGSTHVKQHPVYRLDGFDCQTFVQVVMALLHSKNINQFDKNILKIAYGASGHPNGEMVRYYNRNNFTDGDFNPINQQNGYLTDVTSKGILASYSGQTSATLTRQEWFNFQQKNIATTIQVLHSKDGPKMVERYKDVYSSLQFPHFNSEKVTISYIPKAFLAIQQSNGQFLPNLTLFDKIPTPAVIEIVRDTKKWTLYNMNIRQVIGSELNVSHMGIIYRETFKKGDEIYQKINCRLINQNQRRCEVKPIFCNKDECKELMFVHATASHPNNYFWYQNANGNYVCSAYPPSQDLPYSRCNRVERLPLFNYLTNFQYGSYWYMQNSSILGIHIEKL